MFSQVTVGETVWAVGGETAMAARQGVDAGVAETQSGDTLAVDDGGLGELVEDGVADDRVVADRLGVEEAPVGGEADLPQGGQVAQSFADPEVAGVVDGGLGAKGSSFLVVLLDPGVLVLDVQAGGDALGEDPGAEAALGAMTAAVCRSGGRRSTRPGRGGPCPGSRR